MNYKSAHAAQRRFGWVAIATVLALLLNLGQGILPGASAPTASAHNLQTKMVYMYFDPDTQAFLDNRIAGLDPGYPGFGPGSPLLKVGDELGLIIKVVPRDGTTTGVGGYIDFYVPDGVTVLDAAYVIPGSNPTDGLSGYDKVPMKGQAPIPVGAGPIGAKVKPELIGLTLGPNINGVTEKAVADGTGLMRGTVAGVYGDTGIFFSTHPDTNYDSWVESGGYDQNTGTSDNTLTNNSGDVIVPLNKWDAEQLLAFGAKAPILAIVDTPDQRGNAPWGLANGVAGPQSGYAWDFDWDYWRSSAKDAAAMREASNQMGPWQRIRYDGSRISFDQAGSLSTVNGYASVDGSAVGFNLSPSTPLTSTVSQSDATSPKAIRWSIGQTTQYVPEYAWVKIRVDNYTRGPGGFLDNSGCPYFNGGTFGGDAGGSDNGKDHLWRYYEPTRVSWQACLAVGKPATREVVRVGETFQYKIKIYNAGDNDLYNVVVRDTLPAGVSFISAVPAQNSGPNPLTWNVGTLLRGQKFEATVTIKATVSGPLENNVTATGQTVSGETITGSATEVTPSGAIPILTQRKTAGPTTVTPGGSLTYTITVDNIGSGPTGNPVQITEYLPSGFTYVSKQLVTINGADVTAATAVNATNPNQPIFTVPAALNAGQSLVLRFTAQVSATATGGVHCNTFTTVQNGVPLTSGSEACVTVASGTIGDLIFRDWDGDGVRDPEDEGMAGVTVNLYAGACPPSGSPIATTTTDAAGAYLFTGLNTPAAYCVDPVEPSGYTVTADPEGALNGQAAVNLALNQTDLTIDFGYRPGGAGSIGDRVFEDIGNDGIFDGSDVGISGVTLSLYEDTNGNGVVDAGADALVITTTTSITGYYSFAGLDPTRNYSVVADDGPGSAVDAHFAAPYVSSTGGSTQAVGPADFTAQGNAVSDADFGYFGQTPGSIGDMVCFDANGNALCDAGETGLPNITVTLARDLNGNGLADPDEPTITTSTSVTGYYTFAGLGPGAYVATVDTADPDLPPPYLASVESIALTLAAGQDITTADFPFNQALTKQVNRTSANPGDTLFYTLTLNYKGDALFSNVKITDPLPPGTTFVTVTGSSPNAGGTYGPYTSQPRVPGIDEGDAFSTGISLTVAPTAIAVGGLVTVTMQLTTTQTITQVTPSLTVNGGDATCSGPTPAPPQDVIAGTPRLFTFTCTPTTVGEFTFDGDAEGGLGYVFATGTSNSLLVSLSGGANVVTWNLGSNNPASVGQVVSGGSLPGIYAFRGANKPDFWRYGPLANAWAIKAPAPANIGTGGALAYDGAYIYGLRGAGQKTFYRYDLTANTWTARANTPGNVSDGGALTYLNVGGANYLYAFQGGRKNVFWRYNISGNSWSAMAPAPGTVGKGGALTNDGTYIYALQGNNQTAFWRYDPVANSWTTLANTPASIGSGAGLARIGNTIYATRGGGQKSFYRYDISTGVWTTLAPAPGNITDGGALVTDGTYLYAFQGKTTTFWRYDPATNTWTTRANAPAATGLGAALVYVPGTGTVERQTAMDATPTLVSSGAPISVTMALLSNSGDVNNVAPTNPLTVTASNASAVCTGPTPASQNVISGTLAYFRWNCTLSTTANATGMITFTASASGSGTQFAAANTESVIVVPPLTFRVTVNTPPGVNVVNNSATLIDGSGALTPKPSNTVQTAVTGNIGDYVWADVDGDGVQDPGETGLAGVEVCATPTGGGAAVCATTDALGYYRIVGLTAGASYNVSLNPATVPAGYNATTPVLLTRTATVAGVNDADFGLRPPGQARIGDTIWIDADEDGVLDADEEGLPDITVRLYDSTGTTLLATTTTDASGVYSFTALYSGAYRVLVDTSSVVASPYGVTSTLAAAMDLVSVAGATSPLDNPLTVVVPSDTAVVPTADFGFNWGGSIGDTVWRDDNANGVFDSGEAPIAGAVVLLYFDANGNGVLDPLGGDYQVGIAFTNGSGLYSFDNLPAGKYLVDVYEDSMTTPGGAYRELIPTTADVLAVNLAPGEDYVDADFGYYEGARLEGVVFWDDDRNGLPDAGEQRLEPITVTLTGFDASGTPVSRTTQTDPSGQFVFIVPEGTYTITYSQPSVLAVNPDLTDATTAASYQVVAEAGPDSHIPLLFGVDSTGAVGDRVWNDANGDGVQDVGEPGLPGVTVQLYDASGVTLLASTVTTATGGYLFEGLADGTYIVRVLTGTIPLPAGFTQTGDPDATLDSQGTATVSGGGSDLTMDFGYRASTPTYSVSGTIWKDLANLGVRDAGEPGIAGVRVSVTFTPTGGSAVTVLTTVDASGQYTVTGIPQGSDVAISPVSSSLPDGSYTPTTATTRTINNITTDQTNQDFGYQQVFGGIGGAVVIGPNANGIADVGETPLAGVTVTLVYAGADGILGTADDTTTGQQTNASGQYSFTNLLPGLYQVIETNLPGYLSVADRDGGNPDNITVNLAVGQHVAGRDFEDVPPPAATLSKTLVAPASGLATIGDTITFTIRITNTGDTPLASLTISDTYDAGALTPVGFSVAANSQAAGLIVWTTNISPSLPLAAGASLSLTVAFRADAVTTPGVTTNNATAAGQDVFGQPLGPLTDQASVQIQPEANAQIGDRVWWDVNGNGVQDVGEPGIANVDVWLNGGSQITATNAAGDYLFSGLAAGVYTVTISPDEFQPGGALYNWYATAPTDLIYTVTVTPTQAVLTADFGLNIPSGYAVSKQLAMADPTRPGEPITFTIRVTNTGATWLARLPLQDTYNNTFMTYGFGGDFARPDSNDHVNDGVINWTDALSVTRGGPGLLAPGASTVITVWFTAREDTQTEGSLGTANRITVTAPLFDPDGPGPLEALASQPAQGAAAYVRIYRPTGITVTNFRAVAGKGQVTLSWQTANEAQILGFNVLRRTGGNRLQAVNEEIIPAEHAGSNQGTTYTFTDPVVPAGIYVYVLETIQLDGRSIQSSPIIIRITQ